MIDHSEFQTSWICHVCDTRGTGESLTCSNCFKVTCAKHLKHVSSYNPENGLYQLMPICLDCAIRETIR
jgi:hypothetical protein